MSDYLALPRSSNFALLISYFLLLSYNLSLLKFINTIYFQQTCAYNVRHSIVSGNFFMIFLNSFKKRNIFSVFFSIDANLYSVKQCCTADTTKFGSKAVALRKLFTDSDTLSNIKWIYNKKPKNFSCNTNTLIQIQKKILTCPQ